MTDDPEDIAEDAPELKCGVLSVMLPDDEEAIQGITDIGDALNKSVFSFHRSLDDAPKGHINLTFSADL